MESQVRARPGLDTQVIHAGAPTSSIGGARVLPIFQCSVFERSPEETGPYHEIRYPRLNNLPNHLVLGTRLAAIESAEAGVVTASGMAAIFAALSAVLEPGSHVLVQRRLYGGTYQLLSRILEPLGISYDLIDSSAPGTWRAALRPTTRAIYVESISNPLLEVADHEAVVAFAREHGLVSMVDNTFASPVNFRPPEIGYDLSIHSGTKYLGGHSDLVAGAVLGRATWIDRVGERLHLLGATLDPHACFLLERGVKTLGVRVRQQNRNAQALAEFLVGRAEVSSVRYPGLPSHPDHARAAALFDGSSGLVAVELAGGAGAAIRFMQRLELIASATSLGGVESVISRPVTTSHAALTPQERQSQGVSEGLLRISVGIEAIDDLLADVEQALAA